MGDLKNWTSCNLQFKKAVRSLPGFTFWGEADQVPIEFCLNKRELGESL